MSTPSVRRARVTYEGLVEDHGFYLKLDAGPSWKATVPTSVVTVEDLDDPKGAPPMTDETPDPYRTIPTSSYTTATLRLTDINGNGVEIKLNLKGDNTRVQLETSPETRIENPVTGAEEVTAINLRLTVEDAPQPWSVERVGEWATPPACDTCGGIGRVEWMIEGDPNCYQERDSDGMIPCPDCAAGAGS